MNRPVALLSALFFILIHTIKAIELTESGDIAPPARHRIFSIESFERGNHCWVCPSAEALGSLEKRGCHELDDADQRIKTLIFFNDKNDRSVKKYYFECLKYSEVLRKGRGKNGKGRRSSVTNIHSGIIPVMLNDDSDKIYNLRSFAQSSHSHNSIDEYTMTSEKDVLDILHPKMPNEATVHKSEFHRTDAL